MRSETCTVQRRHPGNLRAYIAVSEVQKALGTYATLLTSPRRHWSLEEIEECLRSDAVRLKELAAKFDFDEEVFV